MKTTFYVRDSWGAPLEGATLTFYDEWQTQVVYTTTTDFEGKAVVELPVPDHQFYLVVASKPGYTSSYPVAWKFDQPEYTFYLSPEEGAPPPTPPPTPSPPPEAVYYTALAFGLLPILYVVGVVAYSEVAKR